MSQTALLQLPFEYVVKSQTLKTEDSLLASLQVVSPPQNIDLNALKTGRSRFKGFSFSFKSHFLPLLTSLVDLEGEIASDDKATANTELLSLPGFWETAEVWSLSYEIWLFVSLYSANYKTSA